MGSTTIAAWHAGPDPGGGNPERRYFSPALPSGWTNLSAHIVATDRYAGSFAITVAGGADRTLWFNRIQDPNVTVTDPDPTEKTDGKVMEITTNSTSPGTTWDVTLFADAVVPPVVCAYGTRPQATSAATYILTPLQISAWLADLGMLWAVPLFAGFYFGTVNTAQLCSTLPPTVTIDLSSLDASVLTLENVLNAIMWPNLCECAPGAPAPTPPLPPSNTVPPGWPATPPLTCSNADICTTLLQVQQQISQLQASATEQLQLVTLMQRYGLPFAYVLGAVHHAVEGSGSFTVPRLVGIQALASFPDAGHPVLEGSPPYQMSKTWMAIQDNTGMIDERRITRRSMVWLPPRMSDATIVTYFLEPGVAVDFTELEAEI